VAGAVAPQEHAGAVDLGGEEVEVAVVVVVAGGDAPRVPFGGAEVTGLVEGGGVDEAVG
jgi:hypothetical protein